ncbi:MAG: D-alanine--D-alanine ligase family protein [Anaerovoracaceae bacterium]
MKKKELLVIFGGSNTEHYVSCTYAGSLFENIDESLFNVLKLGITVDGKWMLTEATPEEIKDGELWLRRKDNKRAIVSPERNRNSLIVFDGNTVEEKHIDCVFPLISGYGGEDGTLQGLLELANVPFVGSAVAASANSMDKVLTRLFAEKCGLKQPQCVVLRKKEYMMLDTEPENIITFGFPVFVKPASLGSSVGITKVEEPQKLRSAIEIAFQYEDKILIEEGIDGKEIKVAVLGNEELTTGEVCEITMPEGMTNDYVTKYKYHSSIKKIPAEIDADVQKEVKRQAMAIYNTLECKGFARVDFFLTNENELYFNEINTVPGLGKNSIYTLMFEKAGMTFTEILNELIKLSFERVKQVSETKEDMFKEFM